MAAPRKTGKAAPLRSRRQPLGRKKANGNGTEKKLADALAQQAATAEILRAIARSRTDERPVFKAIVESAHRLCGASFSILYRYDGKMLRIATDSQSNSKASAVLRALYPMAPRRDHIVGLAVLGKKEAHTADIWRDARFPASQSAHAKASGYRAGLVVPLLRNGAVIGAIAIGRLEAQAFSRGEIGLMRSFADQAVIAIENARLFNETKEALERQTATAEILKVIASSPADIQPVFDAIVETAKRLSGAFSATVTHVGGGMLHLVAHTATTPEGAEALSRYFPISVEGTPMGRAVQSRTPQFIDDFEADSPEARDGRELARSRGFRSVVFVPLMRGEVAIGSLNVTRREAGRVSDHHLGLLKTFADQAVIAIENVRLFNETKEALERQTATAEILKVIAQSPSDVQPVFDGIVASSLRLFGGYSAALTRIVDNELHLAALTSTDASGDEVLKSRFPMPITTNQNLHGDAIRTAAPAQIPDTEADDPRVSIGYRELARARGFRSNLIVPLLRKGAVIGTLSVTRSVAGPFSDHQSELLKTFADQAVIAIENVRLFNETKEALERQTATAEILKVIASSPADVQPVFDVVAERAATLCGAKIGRRDEVRRRTAAPRSGFTARPPDLIEPIRAIYPLEPGSDHVDWPRCPRSRDGADFRSARRITTTSPKQESHARAGYRSNIAVPMLREGRVIGTLSVAQRRSGNLLGKIG